LLDSLLDDLREPANEARSGLVPVLVRESGVAPDVRDQKSSDAEAAL
jgi:hypothetical protein